jgi:hypothetical protein
MPKAIFGITSPLQDGFPIKSDFATCFVEKYLAACVEQDSDGKKIVNKARELMG